VPPAPQARATPPVNDLTLAVRGRCQLSVPAISSSSDWTPVLGLVLVLLILGGVVALADRSRPR
jgi:hypothetical protein